MQRKESSLTFIFGSSALTSTTWPTNSKSAARDSARAIPVCSLLI
jgi:hypothetical protein